MSSEFAQRRIANRRRAAALLIHFIRGDDIGMESVALDCVQDGGRVGELLRPMFEIVSVVCPELAARVALIEEELLPLAYTEVDERENRDG